MQDVKRTFDPDGLLNPGKIVDAPPLTENLRFGPDYQTIELETVFDWTADGGYAPGPSRCATAPASAARSSPAPCVPAYMATRDEQDTTRGRANALRNALAGRIPEDELFSTEMAEVMDALSGLQGVQERMPVGRGHGQDQVRVLCSLLSPPRAAAASTA